MNGSERDRLLWAFRLDEINRYILASREFIVREDYEHALIMFTHVDEELAQLRRAILPYTLRVNLPDPKKP